MYELGRTLGRWYRTLGRWYDDDDEQITIQSWSNALHPCNAYKQWGLGNVGSITCVDMQHYDFNSSFMFNWVLKKQFDKDQQPTALVNHSKENCIEANRSVWLPKENGSNEHAEFYTRIIMSYILSYKTWGRHFSTSRCFDFQLRIEVFFFFLDKTAQIGEVLASFVVTW